MPNPNLNYDTTYWCSLHCTDVEPYDDSCHQQKQVNSCGQCLYCEKQSYSIVTEREDQKEFISPKER